MRFLVAIFLVIFAGSAYANTVSVESEDASVKNDEIVLSDQNVLKNETVGVVSSDKVKTYKSKSKKTKLKSGKPKMITGQVSDQPVETMQSGVLDEKIRPQSPADYMKNKRQTNQPKQNQKQRM